uniref:NF-X1-type zinc finger protein NFXL1 n=1 Tax=Cacopsylla melanoneura TaxID=428564 RepID=A0A8D8VIG9_9HEMI
MVKRKKKKTPTEGEGANGESSTSCMSNGNLGANQPNGNPNSNQKNSNPKPSGNPRPSGNQENIHPKFLEAQAKFSSVIKQSLENNEYLSSSEEEDFDADVQNNIMDKLLASYNNTGENDKHLGKTHKYLNDAFTSGSAVCLICIATIRRSDAIWSCKGCYCLFHLMCIQRWGRDNIAQKRIHHDELLIDVVPPPLTFACPKCRTEYSDKDVPQHYLCFCGTKRDPPVDPWLVPHSCGEHCGKQLVPTCGHICVLLCHPGPCPPCPKMVKTDCQCGQSSQLQRCSHKEWTCNSTCSKYLLCGVHKCQLKCHTGPCQSCPKQAVQPCLCGTEQKVRPCSQPEWQCDKVCPRLVSCGIHTCSLPCHSGPCPPCPLADVRPCPCGAQKFTLPCTQETPSCGGTCDKLLECGAHHCSMRCHKSTCGQCVERIVKRCRCGAKMKEVPCAREFLCETKCKRIRNCFIHPCNRKCCTGRDCPPCEKPCGRTLSCGTHKCQQVCHVGPCYPCGLTETVSCRCGGRSLELSCGAKRKTKPPRCSKPCKIRPDCHHPRSIPHNCHFGPCPPCTQHCEKPLPCSHPCPMKCHSSVLVNVTANVKPAGPWEKIQPHLVKQSFPCDSCKVPITISCHGNHKTRTLPCSQVTPFSCKGPCDWRLPCGNHKCNLTCHVRQISPHDSKLSLNCPPCDGRCTRPRPPGCNHPCSTPCHPHPCPPCSLKVRVRCHCGLGVVWVECAEWNEASVQRKAELMRCLATCPKPLPCGHTCTSRCHPGPCPTPPRCEEKVKVKCPCKRVIREVACSDLLSGEGKVDCNAGCDKKKEQARKAKEEEEERKKREEELKAQQELELFQRKFASQGQRKKQREPKQYQQGGRQKSVWEKYKTQILVAGGFATLFGLMMYVVVTNLGPSARLMIFCVIPRVRQKLLLNKLF